MSDFEKRTQVESWDKSAEKLDVSGRIPDPSDLASEYYEDCDELLYFEDKARENPTEITLAECIKAQQKFQKKWPHVKKIDV